jgi:hypothetical protein
MLFGKTSFALLSLAVDDLNDVPHVCGASWHLSQALILPQSCAFVTIERVSNFIEA